MAGVKLRNLSKEFLCGGTPLQAVREVTTTIQHGSFTVIVGKSGCGKTTLLRLLSGLEKKTAGSIDWSDLKPSQAGPKIGFVFQEPRLMPWLTVYENIAFPLGNPLNKAIAEPLIHEILKLVGLENFRNAYPSQLSGGMAQRVALGRTLCYEPDLILMDEPFGSLDYFTRKKMQKEMVNLFLIQKKTVLFVTHDVTEALFLGQKILVLSEGALLQEIPIDLAYPRNSANEGFLRYQAKIFDALGES